MTINRWKKYCLVTKKSFGLFFIVKAIFTVGGMKEPLPFRLFILSHIHCKNISSVPKQNQTPRKFVLPGMSCPSTYNSDAFHFQSINKL